MSDPTSVPGAVPSSPPAGWFVSPTVLGLVLDPSTTPALWAGRPSAPFLQTVANLLILLPPPMREGIIVAEWPGVLEMLQEVEAVLAARARR